MKRAMISQVISEALKDARTIAALEKTEGMTENSHAYAHALGRANGTAKLMVINLESLLRQLGGEV